MQRDGVAFPEALRILAARAGVEIDERTKREDARKARLRNVLESAIAFYHAVLTDSNAGKPALDYLHGRGFTDETIETYQLGWAPGGWDTMTRTLGTKRDIRPEELVEVGLARPRQSGRGGVYDRFRARVIFPIRDQNGRAVGLGGRLLEGDGPKYLNSPATPLFDKSRTLYLIDKAKGPIRKSGQAVIVEGYTDALMAHQAGFDNVVASLGTALTPGQVALLTRYARRIALAYDVDAAGEKAGTFGVTALAGLIGAAPGATPRRQARGGPGRPAARRQGPRRGRPRDAGRLGGGDRHGQADRRLPHRPPRRPVRPQDAPGGSASSSRDADPPRDRRPGPARRGARRGPPRVRRRGARPAPGPRAAGAQPARRRPAGDGHDGESRITADAVLASPDALPVHDILRPITPVEAELLRLLLLVPDQQLRVVDELGPDQLPSTVARELFRAIVLQRAPERPGRPPAVRWRGAAARRSTTRRRRSPGRCMPSRAGCARARPGASRLRDRPPPARARGRPARERSDYNEAAQGEAERAGDRDAIGRLMLERRQINEARRSLDRRRDQTRLLASHRR